MFARHRSRCFMLVVMASLAGCAGIPADRGYAGSAALLAARGGAAPAVPDGAAKDAAGAEWLGHPLTVESAQRLALTRNPRLLRQYAELGIAQAEVYEAARIANPLFSFAWLDSSAGGAQVALGLAQNMADLLYLSPRKRRAAGELARAQALAAADLQSLAAEAEHGFHAYVGARATAELEHSIADAATASARLAERFFAAGNIDAEALAREQAQASEARIVAQRADTAVASARAELNVLLGVTASEDHWTVDAQPALPPAVEVAYDELARLQGETRLDLVAAREAVVLREDALGVARSYRLVGDINVGVDYEHEAEGSHLLGPTLALTLPIFNWGGGRVARAESELDALRADARAAEIAASNELRRAHAALTSTRQVVEEHRTALVPAREQALLRAAEKQNYMLIGQFELLATKQAEYAAYRGYLEALTGYWQARADLARAFGARLPDADATGGVATVPHAETAAGGTAAASHAGTAAGSADDAHPAGHAPGPSAVPAADPHAHHHHAPATGTVEQQQP